MKIEKPEKNENGNCYFITGGAYTVPADWNSGNPSYLWDTVDNLDFALMRKYAAPGSVRRVIEFDYTVGSNKYRTLVSNLALATSKNVYVGSETKKSCNLMPAPWVNPDPPSFKKLVGRCQRVDLKAIAHVINEGVVASDADCQTLCTNNPK